MSRRDNREKREARRVLSLVGTALARWEAIEKKAAAQSETATAEGGEDLQAELIAFQAHEITTALFNAREAFRTLL